MGERITNVEDQIVTVSTFSLPSAWAGLALTPSFSLQVDLAVQEILLSEGTKAILKT